MSNTEALRKALAVIETDRRALLYSHAYPAGSLTIPADDEAGADALAKYDEAIHAIRTALAQQPAADDRWAAGYKHGLWQAQHCAAQPAATVVERADSATGVVECGSLNVSDNAQPAASGEPADHVPAGPEAEARKTMKHYCCYGAAAEVGCDADCPTKRTPSALKPCPFCGWTECEVIDQPPDNLHPRTMHYIVCHDCGLESPLAESRADAVAAWNRRA